MVMDRYPFFALAKAFQTIDERLWRSLGKGGALGRKDILFGFHITLNAFGWMGNREPK
jgi:hypothetical protein